MALARWYSLRDVAQLLGVHHYTVWRWVRAGQLRTIRVGLRGGHGDHRVAEREVRRLLLRLGTRGASPGRAA